MNDWNIVRDFFVEGGGGLILLDNVEFKGSKL